MLNLRNYPGGALFAETQQTRIFPSSSFKWGLAGLPVLKQLFDSIFLNTCCYPLPMCYCSLQKAHSSLLCHHFGAVQAAYLEREHMLRFLVAHS